MTKCVISYHKIFTENAECMSKVLECKCFHSPARIERHSTYVVFGGHTVSPMLAALSCIPGIRIIIMQSEQMTSACLQRNTPYSRLLLARNVDIVEWSQTNVDTLTKMGVPRPIAIVPYLFKQESVVEDRDIDVFFCGAGSKDRVDAMNRVVLDNPRLRVVCIMDYSLTDPNAIRSYVMRSKVVLNIPYYRNNALETHRINLALQCGCRVVSLSSACRQLNSEYSEYIRFCQSEDLGSAVKCELENFDKEGPFDAVEWEHNYIQPRVKAFVELV